MDNKTRQQWRAWRDDYRCARPAVTCQNCDTHYPRGKDEGNATYIGYSLKSCGNCQQVKLTEIEARRKAEVAEVVERIEKRLSNHIATRRNTPTKPIREIHQDVATRYILLFNGSTFSVQTAPDDADIFLRNAFGLTIAKVLLTDRYPKDYVVVDDLPF